MEEFASQTSDTSYCPNEVMEACRELREHGNTQQSVEKRAKEEENVGEKR